MHYILKAPPHVKGSIQLPASKSISNRALILNALAGGSQSIENLANCDDTNVMVKALTFGSNLVDIGAAGTSMRFLTAFLAGRTGSWEITGSERMKNRPIQILVDALRKLGATIDYLEKEGYPPLRIQGRKLQGGTIDLDGGISSQYLSALLMTAPTMQEGLRLNIVGKLISIPYVRMTLEMMKQFGIESDWNEQQIHIKPQIYQSRNFHVESDWSGASYWYQMLSLAAEGSVRLKGLFRESLQGDSCVASWFEELGVHTRYYEDGVELTKKACNLDRFEADFTDQPDLAQTFVVTCALLELPFHLKGLQSLKIKETDRIQALITEGRKLGFVFTERNGCEMLWSGERCPKNLESGIDTYEDHRMAMAFAPVALILGEIRINHPEVVSKSYPNFWNDLKTVGFSID